MAVRSCLPISALTGDGVTALLDELVSRLPEGPQFYPDDMSTDQPESLVIGEIIREKFLERLKQELPHALVVRVEDIEERDGRMDISADVLVERKSQRESSSEKVARCSRPRGRKHAPSWKACLEQRSISSCRSVSKRTGNVAHNSSIVWGLGRAQTDSLRCDRGRCWRMGSAAVHHLARRGLKVLGLERFDIPHTMGSSHGVNRIIRMAYFEDPSMYPCCADRTSCGGTSKPGQAKSCWSSQGGSMPLRWSIRCSPDRWRRVSNTISLTRS